MHETTATAQAARHRDRAEAARETWVIWLGLFALGIGFGVLVTSHGFPWWLAPVIFRVDVRRVGRVHPHRMLAAGAPIAAVALTTFLINSRHLFYGLSFPLHRVNGWHRKSYSVFALCDEAYALTASKDPETLTGGRILWTQFGWTPSAPTRTPRPSRWPPAVPFWPGSSPLGRCCCSS
jgi:predicted branched-subunit amino acid permease